MGESELTLRIAQGDRRAFLAIFDRYASYLYGLAMKKVGDPREAEDIERHACLLLGEWVKWVSARMTERYHPVWGLVLGDLLALGIVTVLGFVSHGRLSEATLARMLITFLSFSIAWLAIAPWLDLFKRGVIGDRRASWWVALAAVLSAPLGAALRGQWLGEPILPLFIWIMAGVSALLLTAWRLLVSIIAHRRD